VSKDDTIGMVIVLAALVFSGSVITLAVMKEPDCDLVAYRAYKACTKTGSTQLGDAARGGERLPGE
jgi:hypothetical protein